MSKKKHKFRGFAAIVLLAGGIALVKTGGCAGLDITKVIETVTPDTPTPTPTPTPKYEVSVGEPGETRVFDTGEHIVHMIVSRIDENGEYFNYHDGDVVWLECYIVSEDGFTIRYSHTEEFPYGYVEFYYVNTCPVIAKADENGEFTTLGEALEQNKVYAK